jgi:hypothetical protein
MTPPTTQDAGGARTILRPDQERQALETILKNPKNRDVQIWAGARFIELTEPERKLA